MEINEIIDTIVNTSSSIALLVYFVYKDNKFTESIHKALNSIDESLEIIKTECLQKGSKNGK